MLLISRWSGMCDYMLMMSPLYTTFAVPVKAPEAPKQTGRELWAKVRALAYMGMLKSAAVEGEVGEVELTEAEIKERIRLARAEALDAITGAG